MKRGLSIARSRPDVRFATKRRTAPNRRYARETTVNSLCRRIRAASGLGRFSFVSLTYFCKKARGRVAFLETIALISTCFLKSTSVNRYSSYNCVCLIIVLAISFYKLILLSFAEKIRVVSAVELFFLNEFLNLKGVASWKYEKEVTQI